MKRKTWNKLATLLLSVLMVVTFMPSIAFAAGGQGGADGGEAVKISSAEEFAAMEADGNYVLDSDITVEAPYANAFSGTFDGNGHTVMLNIEGTTANTGLFKQLTSGATISNVTTAGSITVTGGVSYTGAIVGAANGYGGIIVIENCLNLANVNAYKAVGGIAGTTSNNVTIRGCVNNASITGTNNQVGGINGNASGGVTTIENCYNTGDITGLNYSGGIVGQSTKSSAQEVIENCYNTGKIKGSLTSSTPGAIEGLNATKGTVNNCYSLEGVVDPIAAGKDGLIGSQNGTVTNVSYKIADEMKSAEFVSLLGEAFVKDSDNINGGYPILAWQNKTPVQEVPVISVDISGEPKTGATLIATANGEGGEEPTSVKYQWMENGEDISGAIGAKFVVPDEKASLGKKYSVTVYGADDSYATSDEIEIAELSDALKVSLDKDALTVENIQMITETGAITLATKGENGAEISWKSGDETFIGNDGTVKQLPESGKKEVKLTATIAAGEVSETKDFTCTIYSQEAQSDEKMLEDAAKRYDLGVLAPVYGRDTNIAEYLKKDIASKGYEGIDVSMKSAERRSYPANGDAAIAENGDITYFYDDPMTLSAMGKGSYAQYDVSFILSKGSSTRELSKVVNIYWDADKLAETLQKEILDKITWDMIKGENGEQNDVTKELTLTRYLGGQSGGNLLAEIKWNSSDPAVIAIKNGSDVIYGDYVASVAPDIIDHQVTLTATVDYKKTNSGTAAETKAIDALKTTFQIKVPAINVEEALAEMNESLEPLTAAKLKDSITNKKLDTDAVVNDIQMPTPKNTGVKDYNKYRFVYSSGDEDLIKVDGYRGNVYRPLPGEAAKSTTLKVRMVSKDNPNLFVEKDLATVNVLPLEQEELDQANALMTKAVEAYWDGIKGENTDKDEITKDLHDFQEVNLDEDGNAVFAYESKNTTGTGVSADTYVEDPDGSNDEAYTRFHSSNTSVIQSGFPRLLTTPERDTDVTIESYLTHKIFGKYYKKYKDDPEKSALFAKLYRQKASVDLTVKGSKSNAEILSEVINDASKMIEDMVEGEGEGEYPAGTKEKLQQAITDAKAVLDNSEATDKAKKQAAAELEKAVNEAKLAQNPISEEIQVSVSNFEKANKFDFVPQEIVVWSNAAEKYGETRDIDAGNAGKVTFADVVYTIHEMKYGGAFTKEDVKDYIEISNSGYFGKLFKVSTLNISYLINEDLTMTGGAFATALDDGDQVALYKYLDETNYSDLYTHFTETKKTVKEGEAFWLQIEGIGWSHPLGAVKKYDGKEVLASQYDKDGNLSAIKGSNMSKDGKVKLVFKKAGTYDVTASGMVNGAYTDYTDWQNPKQVKDVPVPIVLPHCKVTVLPADKKPAKSSVPAVKKISTITVNVKTVNKKVVANAVKKAKGDSASIKTIVLGKKVKKIKKGTFSQYKNLTTLTVKTKKLKKKRIKGALKGSAIKTVKVQIGKKKVNKKYVKKYKKIFTKKKAGKKVMVTM